MIITIFLEQVQHVRKNRVRDVHRSVGISDIPGRFRILVDNISRAYCGAFFLDRKYFNIIVKKDSHHSSFSVVSDRSTKANLPKGRDAKPPV